MLLRTARLGELKQVICLYADEDSQVLVDECWVVYIPVSLLQLRFGLLPCSFI